MEPRRGQRQEKALGSADLSRGMRLRLPFSSNSVETRNESGFWRVSKTLKDSQPSGGGSMETKYNECHNGDRHKIHCESIKKFEE